MRQRARGFTLIELIVVVAILAIASSLASLALRDPAETRLEREAERLAALLEGMRAESRSLGLALRWQALPDRVEGIDFRFLGLPPGMKPPPQAWLDQPAPRVRITRFDAGGSSSPGQVLLGPEPVIGAQRIELGLEERRITVASDGLGPFRIERDAAPR
ncbi:prepilin-type N-terminal cleavage/methylation domain-containing protein [Aquariibacter lacus]|nr:prepilin-type N-terminal cleavage/methylation domain-containing protein [Piscinibacter lacus]